MFEPEGWPRHSECEPAKVDTHPTWTTSGCSQHGTRGPFRYKCIKVTRTVLGALPRLEPGANAVIVARSIVGLSLSSICLYLFLHRCYILSGFQLSRLVTLA